MIQTDAATRTSTALLPDLDEAAAAMPAILDEAGAVVTHGALRATVRRLAAHLPDAAAGRRLVHVPLRAELGSVAAYLAVLEAGHAALVTTGGDRATAILERYAPDLTATGAAEAPFSSWPAEPRHLLHPELALLLSTSGSTGSPKLVRLSHAGVRENARAIAQALRLSADDRAITSLPLHYCFGLSVLHSHLVAGASVVLSDASVADAALWEAVDRLAVTTLALVPHGVDLLESTGELERPHPSLRLVAQAGGRLHPDRVQRLARRGQRSGCELAVMYGQTEATARICVLAPHRAQHAPDAVGTPVPGMSVRLDTSVPEAADGTGEIVVRGPGVMLGYAEHPDDLALGAMLDELRTGDLGRFGDDGQLRIVGRRSGFVKIMGLRIDLTAVERALEAEGLSVCVGGDDEGLSVAVEALGAPPAAAERARGIAARASGLGPAAVAVAVAPLPRRANGKPDRLAASMLVRSLAPTDARSGASALVRVVEAVAHVLGQRDIDPQHSFAQLGGDSLSLVQASVRLEAIVGALPRGWHQRPLVDLAERAAGPEPAEAPRRGRHVETSVLLRALAAITICGSHAGLLDMEGGAHVLLASAGAGIAAFALSAPSSAARWRATLRILIGIAVPSMAVAALGMAVGRYDWSNALFVHWLVATPGDPATRVELWFVEALLWSIAVLAGVLSLPILSRAWREHPWALAAALAVVALVPRFTIHLVTEQDPQGIVPGAIWLVALGMAAAHADTLVRRVLTLAIALVGGIGFFPEDPSRTAYLLAGIAVLVLVPGVRVPRWSVPVIERIAAASLHIYLVQFLILSVLEPDLLETVVALAVGVLVWRIADRPVRLLQELLVPTTPRHGASPTRTR